MDDVNLGYGITGGGGFILIGMPPIGGSPLANQLTWWGNVSLTKDYCLKTVRDVCERFGGDPSAIILSGFSRGSIACNYIGLSDDTIADAWLAFIPHAHCDGQYTWGHANDSAASAYTRLLRLKGRAQHISHETGLDSLEQYLLETGVDMAPFRFRTLPYVDHTDLWTARPIQLRRDTRAWLQQVLNDRPGTHSISGRVSDASGLPLGNIRVQSGYTHFTLTASDGTYVLAGLIDSSRTVFASGGSYLFSDRAVTVPGSNVSAIDFKASP